MTPVPLVLPLSHHSLLFLLLLLLTSATVRASHTSSCFDISIHTSKDCVDDEEYEDPRGWMCIDNGEDASANFEGCWAGNWKYLHEDTLTIIANCPYSCGVCDASDNINILIVSTPSGSPATLLSPGDFDGIGPAVSSPASTTVDQLLCLASPGCYSIRATAGPLSTPGTTHSGNGVPPVGFTMYETRAAYELRRHSASPEDLPFLSKVSSGDWYNFCLDDCPDDEVLDPETGTCKPCPPGTFLSPDLGVCLVCPAGTYSDGLTSALECLPTECPANLPRSPPGATSAHGACYTIEANVYVSNKANRIAAFSPDTGTYVSVVDDDGVLDYPRNMVFVSPTAFLLSNDYAETVELYDIDGTWLSTFMDESTSLSIFPGCTDDDDAEIPCKFLGDPWGLAISKDGTRIVVIESYWYQVYVFDISASLTVDPITGKTTLEKASASNLVFVSEEMDEELLSVSFGSTEDEILIGTYDGYVRRMCIVPSSCGGDARDGVLVKWSGEYQEDFEFRGIASIPELGVYLVANSNVNGARGVSGIYSCPLEPEDMDQDFVTACYLLPFDYVDGPSPSFIVVDHRKKLLYVTDYVDMHVNVVSYEHGLGSVDSSEALGRTGAMIGPNSVALRPGFFARLSYFDAPPADVSWVAGVGVVIPLTLRDPYNDPVPGFFPSRLSILAKGSARVSDGSTTEITLVGVVDEGNSVSELIASIDIKMRGLWSMSILETGAANRMHLSGSPFEVTVVSDVTSAPHCETKVKTSIAAGSAVDIVVTPFDKYKNPTFDADDVFAVWIRGGAHSDNVNPADAVPLSRSIDGETSFAKFTHTLDVSSELTKITTYSVHVVYKNTGEEIAFSPFSVQVFPTKKAIDYSTRNIAAGVGGAAAFLFLVGGYYFYRYRQTSARTINLMGSTIKSNQVAAIEMSLKVKDGERELGIKKIEVETLTQSLKKQKHSITEMEVMKEQFDIVAKKTEGNELKGILIDSKHVKIDSMLGKGAFGVVYLGFYKEEKVAIKQLLNINADNLKRFRFECFLMKTLRHPHVVRLVGVCWDELMLACLIEFMPEGTLQDHIKKDWARLKEEKWTWKSHFLKMAQQAAMGVQYLHHTRYYDEPSDEWKDCIIHRDLKPDNMLLGADFTLKLSDFGEARAEDLNVTMTAVGTPIYMAPEILQNDHYDYKCDVYSFGIFLVALMRAEKDVVAFFFEGLRKKMNKKNLKGIGINILNARMIGQEFRPLLPPQMYPSVKELIRDCWRRDPSARPTLADIVARLATEVQQEVDRLPEPSIEPDAEEVSLSSLASDSSSGKAFGDFESTTITDIAELEELKASLEREREKRLATERDLVSKNAQIAELEAITSTFRGTKRGGGREGENESRAAENSSERN